MNAKRYRIVEELADGKPYRWSIEGDYGLFFDRWMQIGVAHSFDDAQIIYGHTKKTFSSRVTIQSDLDVAQNPSHLKADNS